MNTKYDRRLIVVILALFALLSTPAAYSRAARSESRRFLSPSVEEILQLWREPPRVVWR